MVTSNPSKSLRTYHASIYCVRCRQRLDFKRETFVVCAEKSSADMWFIIITRRRPRAISACLARLTAIVCKSNLTSGNSSVWAMDAERTMFRYGSNAKCWYLMNYLLPTAWASPKALQIASSAPILGTVVAVEMQRWRGPINHALCNNSPRCCSAPSRPYKGVADR